MADNDEQDVMELSDDQEQFIKDVPNEVWKEFCKLVDKETKRRNTALRQEAIRAAEKAAKQFGFKASDLFGGAVEPDQKDISDDKVPSSAIVELKKLAPKGLFNPDAPDDKQYFNKPKGETRWVRLPVWLKDALIEERGNDSRFSEDILMNVIKKYPMKRK